jgi:hypothetical protein
MKVSFGMVGTSMRAGEMMIASGSVVGARMSIMGEAVRSPANGDYDEIGGMMQEKVGKLGNSFAVCARSYAWINEPKLFLDGQDQMMSRSRRES